MHLIVFSELQTEILQTENQLALLNREIADLKEVKVAGSVFYFCVCVCLYCTGVKLYFFILH